MRRLSFALALVFATPAFAVPLSFSHQGRLVDADGAPREGLAQISVALYASADAVDPLWVEVHADTPVSEGYYALKVGGITPIDAGLFAGDALWLGIAVDGDELPQRMAVLSVPYAVRAGGSALADGLKPGAAIDVTSIAVNGSTVLDASGFASGLDQDTLGDLSCGSGQIAVFDGLSWGCGDAAEELTSVPAEIITGTIAIANLPIGTGTNEVASGDHTHTAAQVGALPVGTTAADLGALPVGTTAADIGALPSTTRATDIGGLANTTRAADIGGLASTTRATDIGGVGMGTYGSSCNAAGTLAWSGGTLYACTGSVWRPLAWQTPDGSSSALAATSCGAILQTYPTSSNGNYWIDPDGSGSIAAAQVPCDMTGGGWTRAYVSNFGAGATGWTPTTTSSCGSFGTILGGYNVFGNGATAQYTLDLTGRTHTELRVNHTFVKIDSWDGESGRMFVDGTQRWAKAYTYTSGADVCGVLNGSWFEQADPIATTVPHTANSALIRFDTTLDQAAGDESWGIRDVAVWYR